MLIRNLCQVDLRALLASCDPIQLVAWSFHQRLNGFPHQVFLVKMVGGQERMNHFVGSKAI